MRPLLIRAYRLAPSLLKPLYRRGARRLRLAWRWAYVTALSTCVANTIFNFVGYPAMVSGSSMKPTLNDTVKNPWLSRFGLNVDWVFVSLWAARNHQFVRGEVVVAISPKGESGAKTLSSGLI